ncbi:MAG TPA: helix-turn-helix transcriptional regulator [Abditibacteriaceae bacterium]|jgi:MerR family transcriptional regulator/heat shock protein HspR
MRVSRDAPNNNGAGAKNDGRNNKKPTAGEATAYEGESPLYHISIVAEMVATHPQTLRMYERMGLVSPQRTRNNIRLYSQDDVDRVRRIQHLTQELGVNLAGVEVVFKLLGELERVRAESEAMISEMQRSQREGWSKAELRRYTQTLSEQTLGEVESLTAIVPARIPLRAAPTKTTRRSR